jgi:hypothetical protein
LDNKTLLEWKIRKFNYETQAFIAMTEGFKTMQKGAVQPTAPAICVSIGVITGVVRAISDNPNLKISVTDNLFEKVVNCYLEPEQAELARKFWRKPVSVTGLLYRDAVTGRPIEMREVYQIEPLPPPVIGALMDARGVYSGTEESNKDL